MTTLAPTTNPLPMDPSLGTGPAPTGTVALVLMTYGTPDGPESVQPYLFNIFNDPDLIELPWYMAPFRKLLANKISKSRAEEAAHNYSRLPGGRSPLNELTQAQGDALVAELNRGGQLPPGGYRVFLGMRYWNPRVDETLREIRQAGIRDVVLIPMYPQYSRTTNGSSLNDWTRTARRLGITDLNVRALCCFPDNPKMIEAMAESIRPFVDAIPAEERPHCPLLFSAHGLPQVVIDTGDQYQEHVERTTRLVVQALGGYPRVQNCYQSRVGRQVWLKPYTEDLVNELIAEKVKRIILYPVAFITEHSETLYELDMLYGDQIRAAGIEFHRVPALGTHPRFIEGLADEVRRALAGPLYRPK